MNVPSVKLVYFSPTGTTKKIVREIVCGLQVESVASLDCTKLAEKAGEGLSFHNQLVVLGVPVYCGRVPVQVAEIFSTFTASQTPAVLVVVYGNRAYEDALLELRDIAVGVGFTPIAGSAFIGEHSFSSENLPIAHGRPDSQDLRIARQFGEQIQARLPSIEQLDEIALLDVPGNLPYQEVYPLPQVAPTTIEDLCTQCEECVEACPTGAITQRDETYTDSEKCILCFACIKTCSSGARVLDHPLIKGVTEGLHQGLQTRKEPEMYYA